MEKKSRRPCCVEHSQTEKRAHEDEQHVNSGRPPHRRAVMGKPGSFGRLSLYLGVGFAAAVSSAPAATREHGCTSRPLALTHAWLM